MEKSLTLSQMRNNELRRLYAALTSGNSVNKIHMSKSMIVDVIYEHPAPRFYIERAMAWKYILGEWSQTNTNRRKRDMIADLMENFKRLCEEHPYDKKEVIVGMAIEQPAKSFYMSKHRIKEIIFNYSGRNGKSKE